MGNGANSERMMYVPGENIQKISRQCVNLVNSVIDGEAGVSQETMAMIREYGSNCRIYSECGGDANRLRSLKSMKFLGPEEFEKTKNRFMVFKNEVMEYGKKIEEVYVDGQLMQAIEATLDFVNVMNTPSNKLRKLGDRLAPNELTLAANANRSFVVFFMEIQQKYSFSRNEMASIFNSIFGETNLRQELSTVGENTFPSGVWAVIETYFYLKEKAEEEGWGDGFFYVPSTKEDMHCATDFGWKSLVPGGENRVYQIKGNARTATVAVTQLKDKSFKNEEERKMFQRSYDNISRYEKENQPVKAFWVDAPSRAVVN